MNAIIKKEFLQKVNFPYQRMDKQSIAQEEAESSNNSLIFILVY